MSEMGKMNRITQKTVFLLLFLQSSLLFAQYPLIQSTSAYKDDLFKQQQRETESWYYNNARGVSSLPLSIYRYRTGSGDSLMMLSAAFNLPVDTLATINGIENLNDFKAGQELVIPSAPGLYLHRTSASSWMQGLRSDLKDFHPLELILSIDGNQVRVDYYQGVNLPPSRKTRFVLPLFRSPLDQRIITSVYGYRNHPVTGKWHLHTGTDYRASMNSPVYACGDGVILSRGELEDYGKFIIIKHRNGYTSLYSHLDRILVKSNQKVLEGDVIGESGNTGVSTGPHLHFEIRRNGSPVDPENLLIKEQQ
ncbi:MAG: M23 family metallopeptidase [Spirochaetales bacterium]|nr:M23 family metallopeptidase [Spirochaetales bacterium]